MLFVHVAGCESVIKIPIFPQEIIQKILEYEHYLLMKDHFPKFKYVLKDIKEGVKIILMCSDICDTLNFNDFFLFNFLWKRNWIIQPLEGAALYIRRKRIVCSQRVPGIKIPWYRERHPYYQTVFDECSGRNKPTRQEAKLINYEYFHH